MICTTAVSHQVETLNFQVTQLVSLLSPGSKQHPAMAQQLLLTSPLVCLTFYSPAGGRSAGVEEVVGGRRCRRR